MKYKLILKALIWIIKSLMFHQWGVMRWTRSHIKQSGYELIEEMEEAFDD